MKSIKMLLTGIAFFVVGLCISTYAKGASYKSDEYVYKGYEINRNIAKKFCATDTACNEFIAMELDAAYKQGVAEKRDQRAWDLNIARFAKTKRNLCDNAPDKQMCYAYRNTLLTRYMAGLSSRG